jgi:hypothetical protein
MSSTATTTAAHVKKFFSGMLPTARRGEALTEENPNSRIWIRKDTKISAQRLGQ